MSSALTRRVQLLLDDRRYALLEQAAAERGSSVAAVIRDAIDRALPQPPFDRRRAADLLLASPPMPVGEWESVKADLAALWER